MAKGEGAESGSAAGLLPAGIIQAGERPAQVKVRAWHPEWRARGRGQAEMGASRDKPGSGTAWTTRGQAAPGSGEGPGVPLGAGGDGEGLEAPAAPFCPSPLGTSAAPPAAPRGAGLCLAGFRSCVSSGLGLPP